MTDAVDIQRYLAADLDPIERREFDMRVERDDALSRAFAAAYDAHVDKYGLAAFLRDAPELAECFSEATLQRYVRGDLESEDRTLVEAHLRCPLCGPQVERLREVHRPRRSSRPPRWRRRAFLASIGVAAACALGVVRLLSVSPISYELVGASAEARTLSVGAEWDGTPLDVRPGSHVRLRFLVSGGRPDDSVGWFVGTLGQIAWRPRSIVRGETLELEGEVPSDIATAGAWKLVIRPGVQLSADAAVAIVDDGKDRPDAFVVPVRTLR